MVTTLIVVKEIWEVGLGFDLGFEFGFVVYLF